MMNRLIYCMVLCLALGAYSAPNNCRYTKYIDGIYYKITPGYYVDGTPTKIAVNRKTGDTFITVRSNDLSTKTYILSKDAHKTAKTPVTDVAIDQQNGIVYFASPQGLLKYNDAQKNTEATEITEALKDVFASADGKYVYYTTFDQDHVYKLNVATSKKEIVKDLPVGDGYEIDRDGNIYFIKDRISYVFLMGASSAEKIADLPDRTILDFAINEDDQVYALSVSGRIYKIVKVDKKGGAGHEFKAEEWGEVDFDSSALGFDEDKNMLVGALQSVSYLIRSGPTCPT